MANIKIKTGDYEIFNSGTVLIFADKPTVLTIPMVDSNLDLILEFKSDTAEKAHVEPEVISKNELRLNFFNFNNSLGTGNPQPVEMGTLDNRKLFFSYRVYSLDEKNLKSFEYTLYLQ